MIALRSTPLLPAAIGIALGASVLTLGWKAAAVVLGGVLAATLAVRPVWCLYLLVASIPVALEFGGGLTLTKALLPLTGVMVLANAAIGRCPWPAPWRWPDGMLVTGYLMVAIASVAWSATPASTMTEFGPLAVYSAIAFLTLAFVRDETDIERLFWLLALMGLLQALIAVAQVQFRFVLPGEWRLAAQANIEGTDHGFRAEGTATHPILLAGFLQMTLPFTVLLLIRSRQRARRLLLLATIPLVLYAWKSTYSRSSTIAMAAMVLVALMTTSRFGRWLAAAAVLLGLLVLAAHGMSVEAVIGSIEDIDLFGSAFKFADLYSSVGSFRFRLESWAGGLALFARYPMLGVGLGQAIELYLPYLPAWATSPLHPMVIHNAFIEIACELGVVGLTLFVALWVHAFRCVIRSRSDPLLGGFATALLVVLVGQAVFLMFTPMVKEIWFTLPLAAVIGRISDQRRLEHGNAVARGAPPDNQAVLT